MSDDYRRVLPDHEILDGRLSPVIVDGWPIVIVKQGEELFAVLNRCSHSGSELTGGRIRQDTVMCPLHGARFSLATGRCIGSSYTPLLTFKIRRAEGWIEIAVPDRPPTANELPIAHRA